MGRLMESPLPPVEQRAPGRWQIGTVSSIKEETPRVKSFWIDLPMWMEHLPGQHYDVRLTAPDGYRAQRSYSIASSPLDAGRVELTIDKLEDGEVSPPSTMSSSRATRSRDAAPSRPTSSGAAGSRSSLSAAARVSSPSCACFVTVGARCLTFRCASSTRSVTPTT